MQFNFDCELCLDCDRNGFSVLEGSCQNRIIPGYRIYVKEILDKMGKLSANAQNLESPITTTSRFFPSNHRLFIKADKNKVFGYIKVGPKKLFLRDRLFNYHERRTLSVLDFYVYDSVQRQGIGKQLFDYMLNYEKINPNMLAFDRPTLRLLSFLKKNYGLDNYLTQENNFIIFDKFFEPDSIPYNDTEYDNDTHRVIQNLRTPQLLNSNYSENNFKRNLSYNRQIRENNNPRYSPQINTNSNQYYNNETNNRNNNYINPNKYYNQTENDNRRRAMSPIGEQLIYNNYYKNTYKNTNSNQNYYNKEDSRSNNYNNNRYQQEQSYNKRYNESNINDEYNQRNRNVNRSQDFANEQEYQNYQKNPRFSQNKINDNTLAKSTQINRNRYNDMQNADYYDNRQQSPNKQYY
jgi:alpha-tubulin N-acetyltransferase 1